MDNRIDMLRKLGYADDSPEIQSLMDHDEKRASASAADFDANYRRMVRDMKEGGLVPENAADLDTTSPRVKEALAG